jgi:GT2 family glycosyltransferase
VGRCETIILNYNAGAFLGEAVASVLRSPAVARVLIIDNASTDGSLDQLPAGPDRIVIVRNATNLGFAAGCNVGLERSTADYIFLLNPDCYVEEGAIERLIDVLEKSPNAGICGPVLLNPDGSEQAGGRRVIPTPWRAIVRTLHLTPLRRFFPDTFADFALHQDPLPDHPIEIEANSGACMMVRGAALAEVGFFDEGYFMHCEDLDWCMRFREAGWKILFVPDARIVHHKGISTRSRPISTEWHKHKGMLRFYRKFMSDRYSGGFMGLVALAVYIRFALVALGLLLERASTTLASAASSRRAQRDSTAVERIG